MAPEIMREEPYTKKADVYSFGMIIYEFLTREIPFKKYDKAHEREIIKKVAYNDKFVMKIPENIKKTGN